MHAQMMNEQDKTAIQSLQYCVISHTHWDREWYLPFEEFRLRLVDLIDNVLDILESDPEYRFHLDAQSIVLEDYLEIRPYRRAALARHIQSRRLLVGPWYVQNDFYLTSGEATVRNLLVGSAIAKEFGYCARAGYVPDQFGLIGQLPQIFNGFGLTDCIFGRGYTHYEKDAAGALVPKVVRNEFEWRGGGRSSVLGILMSSWYNNAQRFPRDIARAKRYLNLIEQRLEGRTSTPYLLLMNGVDHLEAQEDLLPILKELNAGMGEGGARICQDTLEGYCAKVKEFLAGHPLDVHEGELRLGNDRHVLQGTLSSRVYLKRDNVRAQALLENCLEPLYAMLGVMGRQDVYPLDHLRYQWKELMKNHPHDSICGCSRDPVHESMEERFRRLRECGMDLLRRGMVFLSHRVRREGLPPDGYLLTVCNTLKSVRGCMVTARVMFPASENVERFRLLDPRGVEAPFEIAADEFKMISVFSPINLPGQLRVREVTIRFMAEDLPGLSYRNYVVRPCAEGGVAIRPEALPAASRVQESAVLENETLKVVVDAAGKVDVLDKTSGNWTRDALSLVEESDLGDSYNFFKDPAGKAMRVADAPGVVRVLELTPLFQSVRISREYQWGAEYDFGRRTRGTRMETNRVDITLSLARMQPWLEVLAEVDNQIKDHRLRLVIHTDLASDFSTASVPFDLVRRDRRDGLSGVCVDASQPNSGLVSVRDEGRGLDIFNEGLFEYEHLMDERHSIALTLLRATGFISHSAEPREPDYLEPPKEWLTPGNQCPRRMGARIGLMPSVSHEAASLERYLEFLVAPLVHFDSVNTRKFTGGRPCVQDSEVDGMFYRDLPCEECHLPLAAQALSIAGDAGIVQSAFKRSEDGTRWILRLFNPSDEQKMADLHFKRPVRGIALVRMDETHVEDLKITEEKLKVLFLPRQILTLAFE